MLLTCALGAAAAEPIEKESGMSHARPVKCRERQAGLSGERWCQVVTVRGGRLKDFDAKSTFCTICYYTLGGLLSRQSQNRHKTITIRHKR